MKHILTLTLILTTLGIFIFSYNQNFRISTLKSNLNQTNSILDKFIKKDTTVNKELLTQEFKENYYITQQQLNQEQIVTYVTVLFSILGIIGTSAFAFYLFQFKSEMRKENERYRNDQKQLYNEHNKHQIDLGLNFANTILTTAEIYAETNQFNYVFQTLMGLANYKHYGYRKENKEQINKIILESLKLMNMKVTQVITSNQPSRNLIWNYLSELTSIKNQEIINEVNLLRSKINDQ